METKRSQEKSIWLISILEIILSYLKTYQIPFQTTQTQQTAPSKQPHVILMEVDSGWKKFKPRVCFKCRKPGHIARDCTSTVDINSMDYQAIKEYMKEEIQKEQEQDTNEKDF